MNQIIVDGYLTKDPVLKHTSTGKQVCNLTLANNEKIGQNKITMFIDCAFWGRYAEVCNQYLKRGSRVIIKGRLERNDYEDNMGIKRHTYKIVGEKLDFLNNPADYK